MEELDTGLDTITWLLDATWCRVVPLVFFSIWLIFTGFSKGISYLENSWCSQRARNRSREFTPISKYLSFEVPPLSSAGHVLDTFSGIQNGQ